MRVPGCLTVLAWTLAPAVSLAQAATISGTVVVEGTRTPIRTAQVRVAGSRVLTDGNGRYRLSVMPGESELVVTALGFRPWRKRFLVSLGQDIIENVELLQDPVPLSQVVTIGTRSSGRTSTETTAPVDVVTAVALEQTGMAETWQAVQRLVPSVNVPHIPRNDDHVRPLTLRGLAPNQVLILVDGKRRHSSAHVQTTPATNGTTSTDVSAIPASAIERIEILRDGAAARYGSDAIAGVINIVLKRDAAREASTGWGQVYSTEHGRSFHDGEIVDLKSAYGLVWDRGGFMTTSAEFRDRNPTNRAYPDARQRYFDGDPRNANPPVISSHEGNGANRDFAGLANLGMPLGDGRNVYGMVAARYRSAESPFGFRLPLDNRTVRAIHPDGFLPVTQQRVADHSGLLGIRRSAGKWEWDVSAAFGRNRIRYDVHNSNNVTLGADSPTDFYAGLASSSLWTGNLDVSRSGARLGAFRLIASAGGEFRRDGYRIGAGEPDSYRDGGIRILDGPSAGRLGAVGSQGFLGFQPIDEIDAQRTNTAAYLDLEASLSHTLLLNLVGRLEKYSGESLAKHGKASVRFEPLRGIAVRGGIANGFRAPSLSQIYHATTRGVLRLVNGVSTLYVIRLLPVNSVPAKLLGARPLRPETSTHLSGGLVIDLPRLPIVTVDLFALRVHDRIVPTSEFTGPQVEQIFNDHGMRGIAGGRYFGNIVDTRTTGVDVVANHAVRVGRGVWRLTGGVYAGRTRVTRIASPPAGFEGFDSVLFNRAQRGAQEVGQPRRTIVLTNNYSHGPFGINLHNQRFGSASLLDLSDPAQDQTVSAKWLTDLSLSYRLASRVTVTATAANLFDVYPDEWNDFYLGVEAQGMSNNGIFRYPGGISPFGMNGRTMYVRLSWKEQ